MHSSRFILALAATAAAVPTFSKRDGCIEPAPKSERFSVAFSVGGPKGSLVSANAIRNGTQNDLVLKGERLSVYPGTEAYANYSNPSPTQGFNYSALNFVLDDGVYGAFAPEIGDSYGNAGAIYLAKDHQEFKWLINNGSISHELQAAPNSLYACNRTLADGTEGVFLEFGDYNYGPPVAGPPEGCEATSVYQNFNIEGGAEPSTA